MHTIEQPDPHADTAPAVSNSANHAHPNRHRCVAAGAILATVLGLIAILGVSALATHTHPLTRAAGGTETAYGVTSSPATTTARLRPSAAITLAAFTNTLDPSSAPLVARPSARGRAALSRRPVHRTSPTRLARSRLKPLPCPDGPVSDNHWDPTRPTNPALHPVSGLHVQLGPVDVALRSGTATAGSHGGRGRHDSDSASDCGCATPAPPAWVPGPWGVPPTVRGHHSSYMPAYPTGSVPNPYVPSAYPNGYAPNPYSPNPYNPGAYNGYPRTYPSYQGSYYPTGTAPSGYYPPNPSARPTSGNLCLTGSGGSGYTVINSSGQPLCQLTTAAPAPSAVAPVSW